MPRLLVILLTFALLLSVPAAQVPVAQSAAPLPQATPLAAAVNCGASPAVNSLLNQVNSTHWEDWIRYLSGAKQVTVGGKTGPILTRNTLALFYEGPSGARSMAFDYVRETVSQWYKPEQIEEDPFQAEDFPGATLKNLILTIPGTTNPQEVVLLTAHLDSRSSDITDYWAPAPGADDNATGSAALLEAARVLQGSSLQRTVRIIWFTGEEQGLEGSKDYVNDHDLTGIVGVINLDMFGYDSDNDRRFELHVGTMPASDTIANCYTQVIDAYKINLKYDYITQGATPSSDHASFWNKRVGAIEVLENGFPNGIDHNPNYHQVTDTIDKLNLPFGFDVTRAALATAFSLANPLPIHNHYIPLLMNR